MLKFVRDRNRWLNLLLSAKQKYGLDVLNYIVTSNHIHILVSDNGNRDAISKSMQLVAGQTGQEYNLRKNRRGAFWEDRYHATAIDSDSHFIRCLVYIDMNMVRAGVVKHPSEWRWSGYNEIQNPKMRYAIINYKCLMELLGVDSSLLLKDIHREWVEESLKADKLVREKKWSQSIAVGSKQYVENVKSKLGISAIHRKITESKNGYELHEDQTLYDADFGGQITRLSTENSFLWNVY